MSPTVNVTVFGAWTMMPMTDLFYLALGLGGFGLLGLYVLACGRA